MRKSFKPNREVKLLALDLHSLIQILSQQMKLKVNNLTKSRKSLDHLYFYKAMKNRNHKFYKINVIIMFQSKFELEFKQREILATKEKQ